MMLHVVQCQLLQMLIKVAPGVLIVLLHRSKYHAQYIVKLGAGCIC